MELHGKRVDLPLLTTEMNAAAIPVTALGIFADDLFTYDQAGAQVDLPPEAQPVVDAHVPPPRVIDYAGRIEVSCKVRSVDVAPVELYRLACLPQHVYQSTLTLIGVDVGNFVAKSLEGRFLHKRLSGNALQVGAIVVLSDIHDSAATGWAPNALPSGTDVVFTVAGAAGRTVDWIMQGSIVVYSPDGLG